MKIKLPNIILEEIKEIQTAKITIGSSTFYESSIVSKFDKCLGGSFHPNRELAIQIGIAEYLERRIYNNILKDLNLRVSFSINEFPSSCGFALGFDYFNTSMRSKYEAIERWVWSRWIDFGNRLDQVTSADLPNEALDISKFFDYALYFNKKINLNNSDVTCCILIGIKDNGIFPGSRVDTNIKDAWIHAAGEAYRHYMQNKKISYNYLDDLPMQRIKYFSNNAEEGLRQIHNNKNNLWISPNIRNKYECSFYDETVFLSRHILDEWIPWNLGGETRFVY